MYTNSKKKVPDKFQKGLLRNMVEVMGILEANSISKVIFGTGKIIAGYQTEDGFILKATKQRTYNQNSQNKTHRKKKASAS